MFSYWAYILIGDNNTGKTSFQRFLVNHLCGTNYQRLPRNLLSDITHPLMPRGITTISTMNRSYQEKTDEYLDVHNFFSNFFRITDICILSSHSHGTARDDLELMLNELRSRVYNVAAVFFSNGHDINCEKISLLNWDERLWVENPPLEDGDAIQAQLERKAREFGQMLIARGAWQ